jgi:hypothetical protein
MAAKNGLIVDRRVSIALDALSSQQRKIVQNMIVSKDRFLTHLSNPQRVKTLSTKQPLYSVSVSPDLRLIYTCPGDDIVVMDLVNKANIALSTSGLGTAARSKARGKEKRFLAPTKSNASSRSRVGEKRGDASPRSTEGTSIKKSK